MNISIKSCFTVSLVLLGGLISQATIAQGWQERRLLAPSAAQQRMEQQDRVYIYDGLHEDTVDQALDTQFERVENMMFVGVRHTTADGDEYADDDCD
jgi:hypothetical protein